MKQLNSLGCRGIREHFAPLREYFFGKNLILRYIAEDCLYSVYPTETVVNTSHIFMQLLKSQWKGNTVNKFLKSSSSIHSIHSGHLLISC